MRLTSAGAILTVALASGCGGAGRPPVDGGAAEASTVLDVLAADALDALAVDTTVPVADALSADHSLADARGDFGVDAVDAADAVMRIDALGDTAPRDVAMSRDGDVIPGDGDVPDVADAAVAVACPAGSDGMSCTAGHCCAGACVRDADPTHCGAAGAVCTAPAHAVPTCCGGACGYRCDDGYVRDADACTPAPPRLIAPLSTARVTSQRPFLAWQLAPGTTGARVEVCADRACARVLASYDVTGEAGAPPTELPAGVVYWRAYGRIGAETGSVATAFTWQFTVPRRSGPHDTAWGTIADFNGDGFADLRARGTSVRVFYGSSAGLPAAPGTSFMGLGIDSADPAGDVNGDGYADLVTATWVLSHDLMQLYAGGPAGLDATRPTQQIDPPPGYSVSWAAGLGDVNGDGYGDVLEIRRPSPSPVPLIVRFGGPRGMAATPSQTLPPIVNIYQDIIVHADFNGDRYEDVWLGDPAGAQALVYYGSNSGLGISPVTLPAPSGSRGFPLNSSAWTGDFNGDGFADLVADDDSSPRQVFVFYGSAAGLGPTSDVVATLAVTTSGLACGDVDGDGFTDLVVALADGIASRAPTFHVFHGSTTGLRAGSSDVRAAPGPSQIIGAIAYDYDGDAYDDFVTGWWNYAAASEWLLRYDGSGAGLPLMPTATTAMPSLDAAHVAPLR